MNRMNLHWLVALTLASGGALANDQSAQGSANAAAQKSPNASAQKSPNASAQKSPNAATADAGDSAKAVIPAYALIVVPVHVASDERLNNGCWARIYENPDFKGNQLTVVGPLDVGKLETTVADDWNGADSLVTGSAATVTTYGEPGFREQRRSYGPNQRNADLRSGPLEKIESLRVTCQG